MAADMTTQDSNRPALTRFDFSETERDMMNAAVRWDIIDAIDLAMFVHEHGASVESVLAEIDSAAESFQHSRCSRRSDWIRTRDAVRFFAKDDPNRSDDEFGFAAEARAKAQAAIDHARVRV